ncbi:hypothetical protein BDQ17DRAFT_1352741 [Cyathus striatus]|nr:hypothetical protein BDQ17DRAFT_1352741 [Cyathus striatus]
MSTKDKKSLRHARSSSITSLSHVAQQMAASPSNRPPSMIGKVEAQDRSNTPETEFDDDASIAESAISISSRIRRNEAERIQYFENQSDCGKLESHRAFCTRCGKFVSLGTKQTYTVRPWEKHRTRCDQKSPRPVVTKAETEGGDSGPVADGSVRRMEADRKALLEADERAEVSEPDRVKCRKCQKWIRLFAGTTKYSLQNWNKHQLSCSGSIPSDRVASAERKLRIVNDAQAKSFDSDSVDCNSCGEHVILKGEGEYNLTKWEEHKLQCISDSKVNATSSPPPPFRSESEGIVSALDTTNLKRGREDEVAADDVDGRPSTRPRIAAYEPPNSEAPGPFGWFMLPFKAFARGFRESLEGESSS